MSIQEQFLEKWQKCRDKRYSVLLIVTPPMDTSFLPERIQEFAGILKADVFNFKQQYKNRLNEFLTWQSVREEIYEAANKEIVIVTELEPFYAKWPENERLAFFRSLLRSEPEKGIILVINCQENLGSVKEIEENSRGVIWVPV